MSEARVQSTSEAEAATLRTRRFTVAEYHLMLDAGVLHEDDRVELLEGAIVEMSPQGEKHMRVITRLTRAFARQLGDEFQVRPQGPLTLGDSEPEPDLAIVRSEDAVSAEEHPRRAVLAVEVATSSLVPDRTVKSRIYARAGILEYWLVDVGGRCVEIRRGPDQDTARYRSVETLKAPGALTSPPALTGFSFQVADLFD